MLIGNEANISILIIWLGMKFILLGSVRHSSELKRTEIRFIIAINVNISLFDNIEFSKQNRKDHMIDSMILFTKNWHALNVCLIFKISLITN